MKALIMEKAKKKNFSSLRFCFRAALFGILLPGSFMVMFIYEKRAPFFVAFIELFLILITVLFVTKMPNNIKSVVFNLIFILGVLGALEGYFMWNAHNPSRRTHEFIDGDLFDQNDNVRGYSAKKGVRVGAHKTCDGEKVFDVIYTTNQFGLRISPHDLTQAPPYPDYENVVFFGCSYTFGHGVNDNEALPFIFENISRGKYKTYNFAQNGYGPHQMLSILESDLIDEIITDRKPTIAIYSAIAAHIGRSAMKGLDRHGPRYQLNNHGSVAKKESGVERSFLLEQLFKCFLFKAYHKHLGKMKATKRDIDLFVRIVRTAAETFKKKYGGKFYVIYWDENLQDFDKKIMEELEKERMEAVRISQILNDRGPEDATGFEKKYKIEKDSHPNRKANEQIAEYLLKHIS